MSLTLDISRNSSLTEGYLKLHSEYQTNYGEKCAVLMQVGSFFECYSTDERGPDLFTLSSLLNIIHTRKDKSIDRIDEKNPRMMGFPCVSLNKNLKILIDDGYTVVIIEQKVDKNGNIRREVTDIFSPSTYTEEVKDENNFLLSLYLTTEKQRDGKVLDCYGLAWVDLNVGKVWIDEYISNNSEEELATINLSETLIKLNPKEILIYTDKEDIDTDLFINYNHRILKNIDKTIHKISYQETFLKKVYGDKGVINTIEYLELERKPYAIISLINALDFCYLQNNNLLKRISKPELIVQNKVFMGNNTLQNLNIISKENKKSLFEIVDNTSTVMGRRLLKERLLNPEIDHEIINKRYNQIGNWLKEDRYLQIEKYLKNIKDLERFSRRIVIKKLQPMELFALYTSMQNCVSIEEFIGLEKSNEIEKFLEYIQSRYNLTILERVNFNNIENFYLSRVCEEIDKITDKMTFGEDLVSYLIKTLNGICKEDLKFEVKNNKKEGQFLVLTKKRGDKLENFLKHWEKFQLGNGTEVKVKYLEFSHTKTTTKIKIPKLEETHTDANILQNMIQNTVRDIYLQDLEEIGDNFLTLFTDYAKKVAELDFTISNCITVKKYNYCKPEISSSNEDSFVNFENLRHPIIERIIDYEYVPQTLSFKDTKGVLLYGLNSSGKSSFQKSIGMAIILAQAGMYVPATSFHFSPYKYILTRIDGNDNLFKGLSSFTLEMMDLKNILKYSSKNTLIIGDEVCKGTEYLSANAILASTIIKLSQTDSTFIFATHLHQIPKMEKIKCLENVKSYYLEVKHHPETNSLIFERTLKEGQGEEVYGILVANNIIGDLGFSQMVNILKNDILKAPNTLLQTKKSRYNSSLYIDGCEICGKRDVTESYHTHHIHFQKDCKDGFVKDKAHIPMNGKMNLMILCEDCHHEIHSKNKKI